MNAYNSETRAARANLRPDLDSLFSFRCVTVDELIVYATISRCRPVVGDEMSGIKRSTSCRRRQKVGRRVVGRWAVTAPKMLEAKTKMGETTLSTMIFSITTLSIMTFSKTTFKIMILNAQAKCHYAEWHN